jgi:hypothetical protein
LEKLAAAYQARRERLAGNEQAMTAVKEEEQRLVLEHGRLCAEVDAAAASLECARMKISSAKVGSVPHTAPNKRRFASKRFGCQTVRPAGPTPCPTSGCGPDNKMRARQ